MVYLVIVFEKCFDNIILAFLEFIPCSPNLEFFFMFFVFFKKKKKENLIYSFF